MLEHDAQKQAEAITKRWGGKRALTPGDLVEKGVGGRTAIFAAIKTGKLKARKAGARTLILAEDAEDYLNSLPVIGG